mmetsp:Transcript_28156/g.32282  ORF Transcript_28156/g.32282 Transcript_28156/m.32282 type:complete len:220 (-) Transcript_28156:192-851(-)
MSEVTALIENHQKQLEEIKGLLEIAERPRFKALLQNEHSRIKSLILNLMPQDHDESDDDNDAHENNDEDRKTLFTPLNRFTYSQNLERIKFTVVLDNIQDAPTENIELNLKKQLIDLQVHDFNGKNFRFLLDPTVEEIVPDQSSFVVKENSIHLSIKKKEKKHWSELRETEDTIRKKDENLPMSDVVKDFARHMYSKGDDSTKQMIEEAYTKVHGSRLA